MSEQEKMHFWSGGERCDEQEQNESGKDKIARRVSFSLVTLLRLWLSAHYGIRA